MKCSELVGFYVSPEVWCSLVLPAVRTSAGCRVGGANVASTVAVGPVPVEIEVNSRNWNLCSRGKYFLCNLFLLWSNLPASFNSNDRVFIYLEKVFGKKVVATHTWIQDGWEQGGLYCQRSCLLALLLTLEVAEKACKVWEKKQKQKKSNTLPSFSFIRKGSHALHCATTVFCHLSQYHAHNS